MKLHYKYILCSVMTVLISSLTACKDDFAIPDVDAPLEVVEGIPGELSLSVAADAFSKHTVATRENTQQSTEQHAHSVYLFMLEHEEGGAAKCKILTRRYYSDFSEIPMDMVTIGGQNFLVRKVKMPAISSNKAFIFGIVNIGHSEVQGVANDAQLLKDCESAKTLQDLHNLCAKLEVTAGTQDAAKKEVDVERMQGHHLMSGFFTTFTKRHFEEASRTFLKLQAQKDGTIKAFDFEGDKPLKPIGGQGDGEPSALFAHRLDAKVTVKIFPEGTFATTPGAYFKLTSWKVVNAPYTQHLYWQGADDKIQREYGDSKMFKRDLNQIEGGGWTFSFYQFENFFKASDNVKNGFKEVGSGEIANQYNIEYNYTNSDKAVTSQTVEGAFLKGKETVYPNKFSDFAYTMRELEHKKISPENEKDKIEIPYKPGEEYVPNKPEGNNDDVIIVDNAGFKYAPANSTYVRITGEYYNPQEPVRRRKDTDKFLDQFPLDEYPYLNLDQKPVKNVEDAAKRMRIATVVYRIHLGYVGGGNAALKSGDNSQKIQNFGDFKEKLNDYNVLRNHHYIYNVKIAGVNNVKLEATRENGGNILEQENQPGAEGVVTESQHFFELDSHYETRNVTIDFRRMPENYTEGFSFGMVSPFDRHRGTLKKGANGKMEIIDQDGNPLTTIKGRDLEWVHFAWHGDDNNPSRSLIDPNTGNGIPYSETYGGYEDQQTYIPNSKLTHDQDATHKYKLYNALEFSHLVWTYFKKWKDEGKPDNKKTMTFTIYVDEYYYDLNPTTGAAVNWTDFCNQSRRKMTFFMEKEETSADQQSWYSDAHLVIYQNSIQTLYATETSRGQQVADVAFGIESLDEFRAKYRCNGSYFKEGEVQRQSGHGFVGSSKINGLFNTMSWYKEKNNRYAPVIDWKTAEGYFNVKALEKPLEQSDYNWTTQATERDNRRGQWAVYSRNRDLNRDGKLNPDEIRWFVPAIDQYTLCFLGGRPVFRNPLFERDKAVMLNNSNNSEGTWTKGFPVLHYMSNTDLNLNRVFWSEEGCAKSNYSQGQLHGVYGIRMARMLTKSGIINTGKAFENVNTAIWDNEKILAQDELFLVTTERNGSPVSYDDRVDGRNYYVKLHKLNVDAFRSFIKHGEIGQHHHEQKQNWLYKEFCIARHKIGYPTMSQKDYKKEKRIWIIDGYPNTWWRVNGVVTDNSVPGGETGIYFYRGEENSMAYDYYELDDSSDKHHWRVPNLREAAIMSMAFPKDWFLGDMENIKDQNQKNEIEKYEGSITTGTKSTNLGPHSTKIPYFDIRSGTIGRMQNDEGNDVGDNTVKQFVRGVYDVR